MATETGCSDNNCLDIFSSVCLRSARDSFVSGFMMLEKLSEMLSLALVQQVRHVHFWVIIFSLLLVTDSLPSCTITIFLSFLHVPQEDPQKQHFRHIIKKVTIDTTASVIIELTIALY